MSTLYYFQREIFFDSRTATCSRDHGFRCGESTDRRRVIMQIASDENHEQSFVLVDELYEVRSSKQRCEDPLIVTINAVVSDH